MALAHEAKVSFISLALSWLDSPRQTVIYRSARLMCNNQSLNSRLPG